MQMLSIGRRLEGSPLQMRVCELIVCLTCLNTSVLDCACLWFVMATSCKAFEFALRSMDAYLCVCSCQHSCVCVFVCGWSVLCYDRLNMGALVYVCHGNILQCFRVRIEQYGCVNSVACLRIYSYACVCFMLLCFFQIIFLKEKIVNDFFHLKFNKI